MNKQLEAVYKKYLLKKLKISDYVLIVGVILAPMTNLRIWKIGPAELLCFIWALFNLKHILKIKSSDYYVWFWIPFLVCILMGTVYGAIFYPKELVSAGIITWLYLGFISVITYAAIKNRTLDNIERIIYNVCVGGSLWYLFLWWYNLYVSHTFLGAGLMFAGVRYTGGAKNPHQLAILCLFVPFYLLRRLLRGKGNVFEKLLDVFCIAACVYLVWQTDSATAKLAIVVASISVVILEYLHIFKSREGVLLLFVILFTLALGILLFFGNELIARFNAWVASDSNGEGRYNIFSYIGNAFAKSPIIGLGPGIHSRNGAIEFHNTYLEIVAMTGLLGSIVFLWFSIKMFLQTYIFDYRLLPVIVSLYAFGLANFGARQLVYCVIMSITVCIVIAKRNAKVSVMY